METIIDYRFILQSFYSFKRCVQVDGSFLDTFQVSCFHVTSDPSLSPSRTPLKQQTWRHLVFLFCFLSVLQRHQLVWQTYCSIFLTIYQNPRLDSTETFSLHALNDPIKTDFEVGTKTEQKGVNTSSYLDNLEAQKPLRCVSRFDGGIQVKHGRPAVKAKRSVGSLFPRRRGRPAGPT